MNQLIISYLFTKIFLQLFYNVTVSESNEINSEIAAIDIADQSEIISYKLIGDFNEIFSFDENTGKYP